MNNIIGLNTRLYGSNLNIAPAVESQEEEQVEETTPERVLNPIVSESYMNKYIEEHGGGGTSESVTLYFNVQDESEGIHEVYKDRTLTNAYTTYNELKNDIAGKNVIFKGILGSGVEVTYFPYSLYDVYIDDEQYTYFYSLITMIIDGHIYPVDIGVRSGGK